MALEENTAAQYFSLMQLIPRQQIFAWNQFTPRHLGYYAQY